ncbi:MAG: error-prone DNA polymerase [Gammaproteobacteria bacterium]|nr:error-prone DNA polymerase [Gammaproteobacteria bacterium]
MVGSVDYAELHCLSNFTFLRGASHPEELVERTAKLGYRALAITDECSLAGVVRAHVEAKQQNLPLIIGSEFCLDDGLRFVLLATDRESYGHLSALITRARRQAEKGSYRLTRDDLVESCPAGCLVLWLPADQADPADGQWLKSLFPEHTWIAVELILDGNDDVRLDQTQALSEACDLPRVACGNVHMHCRSRRVLQDVLTAIRLGRPLAMLGYDLYANAERYLRSRKRLSRLYPAEPLVETVKIAGLCNFSLDELRYEYPKELVPAGHTASSWLRHLTQKGMRQRWPHGVPDKVVLSVERELKLIQELRYEPYFLTVYDIVRFAKRQHILCQGRGSAANSAVCYCLSITEVDPARLDLLFERFVSKERNEPPDIDVDFEHERREEVIQYIYQKYGRERAALAATVITYQPRSAIRDVGKALGMSLEQVDRLAKSMQWWDGKHSLSQRLAGTGFTADNPLLQKLVMLVNEIIGFPRHLSQHVGGFVISQGLLSHLVPIENAAMDDRTVIQWEKDDLESLGLLKVDVLGLGMLTAIRKSFALIEGYSGRSLNMANVPAEDPAVYAMIQKADTIGVFQIESRAQMTMLPRLRPTCYYDLVIEIAIVRPGPIQGEMVHPYLARRSGKEEVTYPSQAMRAVLERTLGVPIFQEQVMQIAVVAAGFTPGEADQLRRSMAAWKRRGGLEKYESKLKDGMRERGYSDHFATQIFNQIKGFGEYGFPESHSASFALLAYVSAWLKCHEHAAFTCGLLNSQPMGFYAPAQLIGDAQRHDVEVRPVDVQRSLWDCTLEPSRTKQPALRLGLRMIKGLSEAAGERIVERRRDRQFRHTQDLMNRAALNRKDLECLAAANALFQLAGHRHRAHWEVSGAENETPLLQSTVRPEAQVLLRKPHEGEEIIADYVHQGFTLGRHPLALLRDRLNAKGVRQAKALWDLRPGSTATVAGLVTVRQRPSSASGVIFVTLEDESGYANIIVWPKVAEAQRQALLKARLLSVTGIVQKEDNVLHIVAGRMEDYSAWLGELQTRSRDFH